MKIKVCGLMNNPASVAISQLPTIDYLGFIFAEQSPRFTEETVSSLNKQRVGVFVNASLETILVTAKKHQLTTIQLHGDETSELCSELKSHFHIIKAIGIDKDIDFETLSLYESVVDTFLFDTKSEQRGGTGIPFDWAILDRYQGSTPFFLSGGIGEESITEIQQFKHPFFAGIDLNSRFEIQPGVKDIERIQTFIQTLYA